MSNTNKPNKVIVGMSGGVDSSVTAWLLLEQGYQVEGLFMKNWEEDDGTEYCTAKQDLSDAQQVCDKLGINLHTANFAGDYWDNVFEHFIAEYRAFRTPNPDILCNREIKFKVFLEYAEMLGAELIATGHYARLDKSEIETKLLKGKDPNKDQSYFLHAVSSDAFSRSLFPLGELLKDEVREIAKKQGFVTHSKKDSTGICFIGERRFKDFLENYIPSKQGDIKTLTGDTVGTHDGLMFYTLGQRQGLHIGGVKGAEEAPWYVIDKDVKNNVLVVDQGSNSDNLYTLGLTTSNIHFVGASPLENEFSCSAKTRYRQEDQDCRVLMKDGRWHILFTKPQRAVTPGQSVVLYDNERCLGGGVIETTYQ